MDLSLILLAIFIGFLAIAGLLYWFRRNSLATPASIDPQSLLLIQQGMGELRREMREALAETGRQTVDTSRHLSMTMTTTVRDVTERLVRLEETNKQILSFSGQLDNLQRILTNPKQRGILGDYYL